MIFTQLIKNISRRLSDHNKKTAVKDLCERFYIKALNGKIFIMFDNSAIACIDDYQHASQIIDQLERFRKTAVEFYTANTERDEYPQTA